METVYAKKKAGVGIDCCPFALSHGGGSVILCCPRFCRNQITDSSFSCALPVPLSLACGPWVSSYPRSRSCRNRSLTRSYNRLFVHSLSQVVPWSPAVRAAVRLPPLRPREHQHPVPAHRPCKVRGPEVGFPRYVFAAVCPSVCHVPFSSLLISVPARKVRGPEIVFPRYAADVLASYCASSSHIFSS